MEPQAATSFIDQIHHVINLLNGPLWTWLVPLLLGTGLFFTLRSGFVQVRLFRDSVRAMFGSRAQGDDEHGHGITSFQAFATGLASRVGTGNIAGVAIAIATGGPGAVFWMWITALLGMSSAFAESSLAQLFKVRDHGNRQFRGGPAYYITQGMGQKWMGVLFAISLIFCFGFAFNAIQANTIIEAVKSSTGCVDAEDACQQGWMVYKHVGGAILIILSAPIIFGGIRRVARFAEAIVPVMAALYLLMALYVMLANLGAVPAVFGMIFSNAFTLDAAGGGLLGGMVSQAMMLGIKRGLFSNEAGMGSAPNAAAAADVKHPVSQGLIQMLGVFVDTLIVCSCTAFIILLSGVQIEGSSLTGAQLTQAALESQVGSFGQYFLVVVLFLFAFSSIIGNYAYAESNMQFIHGSPRTMVMFRMVVLGFVYFGAINSVPVVWDLGDLTMGVMAVINLIAILILSPMVFLLLKDYLRQQQAGETPQFKLADYPELQAKVHSDLWN